MSGFSTPRGTEDILPDQWRYWNFVSRTAEDVAILFGYRRIETPTFAETSLFARTSGEGSDIVDHEMYTFEDRGGDTLTLRPEGTAPVMRAYIQHGMNRLPQPVKLFYFERMFRYDRPQQGRYREHHQFGCEAIGSPEPYVDVEMIALLAEFYRRLGLTDVTLHINSIGDSACRPAYVESLVTYLQRNEENLAPLDRERLRRNPLRVLDSKEKSSQRIIDGAPKMLEYLCTDCSVHWERVRHGLEIADVPYVIDGRLVRGLNYYTRTAFEFMPPGEGAQSAVGAGGRYDALSEAMGGPAVPGVGFGAGLERIILEVKRRAVEVPNSLRPVMYVAFVGEGTGDAALTLAQSMRRQDVPVEMTLGALSLKTQMKRANSLGAAFAAIIGDDELRDGCVTIRRLSDGEQRKVAFDRVLEAIRPL